MAPGCRPRPSRRTPTPDQESEREQHEAYPPRPADRMTPMTHPTTGEIILMVCPDCHGSGDIPFNHSAPYTPEADDFATCPTCHGNGAVEVPDNWSETRSNLVLLTAWMARNGHNAENVAYAVERPDKHVDLFVEAHDE